MQRAHCNARARVASVYLEHENIAVQLLLRADVTPHQYCELLVAEALPCLPRTASWVGDERSREHKTRAHQQGGNGRQSSRTTPMSNKQGMKQKRTACSGYAEPCAPILTHTYPLALLLPPLPSPAQILRLRLLW